MAHYIDIDKIEYRKGVLLDDSMPIIRKVVTIDDIRDWTPKADVVEKSKIDKAIEEIRKLSPKPTVEDVLVGNPEKDEIWAFLVAVLNIIEKNIGGEE